jgi:hypothetical protein
MDWQRESTWSRTFSDALTLMKTVAGGIPPLKEVMLSPGAELTSDPAVRRKTCLASRRLLKQSLIRRPHLRSSDSLPYSLRQLPPFPTPGGKASSLQCSLWAPMFDAT